MDAIEVAVIKSKIAQIGSKIAQIGSKIAQSVIKNKIDLVGSKSESYLLALGDKTWSICETSLCKGTCST